MAIELRKTPLAHIHEKLGASMVEFSGWYMPVQYTNVIDEHTATRTNAGLFDICHMGEFDIKGKDAAIFLQKMMTNDIRKLENGKAIYSCMCFENGTTVDDCFLYQYSEEQFMLVVNAGTIEKDFAWLNANKGSMDVRITDKSEETAKLDLQGPKAEEVLQPLTDADLSSLQRFHFVHAAVDGIPALISRTGYTGEDGFELYFHASAAGQLWGRIMKNGLVKAVGLGARDTLRLEACYSLYGHELSESITPMEAGIGWVVHDKQFIGSEVLLRQKKEGAAKINVALEMAEKGIPREHYPVFKGGQQIGEISSGTFSPTFRKGIAMAFIKSENNIIDDEVFVKIRDKMIKAKIVKKPFYAYRQGEKGV